MNRLWLGLLLLIPALGLAQSPEQLYLQGNEAYQQGNQAKAIELYESVLQNGYVSGDLYYNLGNAYYRTGNLARAILNYERASRLMPADDDLKHNLQLANSLIIDKIEHAPRLFVWDWWDGLRNSFSVDTATWLAYAMFISVLVSVGMLFLLGSYRWRLISLWSLGVFSVLLLFFIVVLVSRITDSRRMDEAVVMTAIVTVKNSPDEKSSDAFVLHSGLKVQMMDRVGAWVQIRLSDGKVGWMPESGLEIL